MSDIRTYLTDDHRSCDDLFAQMEEAVSKKDFQKGKVTFAAFANAMERHFQMEERVMFPEFEQKSGMTMGPTQVMRMEHVQMRKLIEQIERSVATEDANGFFGLSETLMILMQQHNMKEEQMLYNMAQQHLSAESDRIVAMMDALVVE